MSIFRWSGNRMHNALREQVRLADGRHPQPSAALVDSRSVRAAETVARSSRGFDGGRKVNGRKRHIATDTTGLLLVTAASVQDRDGGRWPLWAPTCCFPRVSLVWADSGYAGQLVDWATNHDPEQPPRNDVGSPSKRPRSRAACSHVSEARQRHALPGRRTLRGTVPARSGSGCAATR
jgi:DDE family transposase